MSDAREFFAHVPTTAIADVSVLLGLSLIMEGLQPLAPLTAAHVAAPATTLQFVPAQDPTLPRVSLYDVLEDMAPGTCLVVAASASPLAVLGANGARVAARRGAVGAVVDGAVRDVRALDALGLPVWRRSVRPLAYTRRLECVGRDVPVTCGGVQVAPGDLIVADADGVAVVPQGRAAEIRRRAAAVMAMEEAFTQGFQRGESAKVLVGLKQQLFRQP
ncbi:MAG TPA: RraA family protein [Chloroflexota bacterium]|nr:RraA family protein [Chloroflexota bacterium]